MTLASRIHDLAAAIAAAVNARSGIVGASAYDLYVINGGTLTQTQWLQANAPRYLTDAQRTALTGTDLFEGREVVTTDTKRTWKYISSAWQLWVADGVVTAGTNTTIAESAVSRNGRVGTVRLTLTTTAALGQDAVIATIPAGFEGEAGVQRGNGSLLAYRNNGGNFAGYAMVYVIGTNVYAYQYAPLGNSGPGGGLPSGIVLLGNLPYRTAN